MDQRIIHLFFALLRSAICGAKLAEEERNNYLPDLLYNLLKIASKHDVVHLLVLGLKQNDLITKENAEIEKYILKAVYRYEQIIYEYENLCAVLEKMQISFLPLKGSVIRNHYPEAWMRTSCDIDILIHENDLKKAIISLQKCGYKCGKRNYHDVSLYAPNDVHLELHFSIQENMDNLDEVLKNAWNYAVLTNGTQYSFSNEFFAFHIFAHMAYHFLSGGCGIRSLLDVWIMEHKMNISHVLAKELLEKAGIYKFAVEMSKLAERCFTYSDIDAFSDSVLKYIFQGGVYGNTENRITINKIRFKWSIVYIFKRLFLPYKSMVMVYPILKKAPYLLPLCWVVRWTKAILGSKSEKIFSELWYVNNISAEKIKEVEDVCLRLGF